MKRLILIVALILLSVSPTLGAPLADCARATVVAAEADTITYPNGSTIELPAGTCSWDSAVTIDRALTIKGKTTTSRNASTFVVTATDATIIQKYGFNVTATAGVRITGITFDGNVAGAATQPITLPVAPVGMRVDHNHFSQYAKVWNKSTSAGYRNVLFDNNRVTVKAGGEETLYIVGGGNTSWSEGGTCGSANPEKTTWLEDNQFVGSPTQDTTNLIDMGEGARVTIRSNLFSGDSTYKFTSNIIEAHGHCWGQKDGNHNAGVYCLEVSGNRITNPSNPGYAGQNLVKTRGGRNYVYNNTLSGSGWNSSDVSFWVQEVTTQCNNTECAVQAHEDLGYHAVPLAGPQYTAGLCTSYPCPMQVNNSYVFGNTDTAGTFSIGVVAGGADYAQVNRDWWDDITGTFTKDVAANRAGTCTAQDSYWETDNLSLYRCTATNTWTLEYSAQSYPIAIDANGFPSYSPDITAPTITAFAIPAEANSFTVSVTAFTATDAVGVTGYCLVETNDSAGCSWSGSAPATYVFASEGAKTLYAFTKDAADNVSDSANDSVVITLPISVGVLVGGSVTQ